MQESNLKPGMKWVSRENLIGLLWALLLVAIPITSSPWVARFVGMTPVSPLSGAPLFLLVFVFLLPYFFSNQAIPKILLPFLVFVFVALIASLRAPYLGIPSFKGQAVLAREIRALITLAVGGCFFLVASLLPRSEDSLKRSLGWLYVGAVFMLLWSSVQIYRLPYSFNPQPPGLNAFHRLFSIRDLFRTRVTGFSYEPSWLADQLAVLYIPLWLGSVVKGFSVIKLRWKWVTLELGLLIWGSVVFFFTYSRIGMIAVIFAVGVLVLVAGYRLTSGLGFRMQAKYKIPARRLRRVIWLLGILLFMVAVIGIIYLAVLTNERIRDQFTVNILETVQESRFPVVYNLANRLEFAERLIYWVSAFLVFSRYPFLGVGLGNTGFFFRETVPAFSSHLPEINFILSPNTLTFANPKSLWLRLLAETGLLGFMAFLVWLMLLGLSAFKLQRREGLRAAIGVAGGMALLVQIFEGLSLDTFALPQLWVMLGLLTAAYSFDSRNPEQDA